MNAVWVSILLAGGLLGLEFRAFAGPEEKIDPSSNPAPIGVLAPSPQALAPGDGKALLNEFSRAQANEIKALQHRHKFEIKELKAAQDLRKRDWEKKEREARYRFFETHTKGPERRAYIQSFLKRREEFFQSLKDEMNQNTQEQADRMKKIQQEQVDKLKAFKTAIAEGKKPEAQLWPTSGT